MRFFGDNDHSWMVAANLRPYREHYTELSTPKKGNDKDFKKAMKLAQQHQELHKAQTPMPDVKDAPQPKPMPEVKDAPQPKRVILID